MLSNLLYRLDGKPYPAYKDLLGSYDFDTFTLSFDRIQGDPFAAPSRLSLTISHAASQLPATLFSNRSRRIGTENYLALAFSRACLKAQSHLGSGKSGLIAIDTPGQEILERTCVQIDNTQTTVHFVVGLPANGRRIMGRAAESLILDTIPHIIETALVYPNLDVDRIQAYADTNEDAETLRCQLADQNLVAFIADKAILPRASGIDQAPLPNAIPFTSPDSQRVSLNLANGQPITGMGIFEGVTLIVGGGYHGKSTLLSAIERGVYNHRPNDGREHVVTTRDATKVRAEDGRSVVGVNLTPFINNLPGGKSTESFTTENASGSTSQAASIIEAIEIGAKTLLIDEDISATNFLIRDERMQQLIAPEKEPITPFVNRVRALYDKHNISTILVLGGSGDYFAPADRIIALDTYLPKDVTQQAKALSPDSPPLHHSNFTLHNSSRHADPSSINPYKSATPYRGNHRGRSSNTARPLRQNVKAHDTRSLTFGTEEIDLSLVPQIVDPSQARTLGAALAKTKEQGLFETLSIPEAIQEIIHQIQTNGLSDLSANDLAEIRPQELAATLNRLRSLRIQSTSTPS